MPRLADGAAWQAWHKLHCIARCGSTSKDACTRNALPQPSHRACMIGRSTSRSAPASLPRRRQGREAAAAGRGSQGGEGGRQRIAWLGFAVGAMGNHRIWQQCSKAVPSGMRSQPSSCQAWLPPHIGSPVNKAARSSRQHSKRAFLPPNIWPMSRPKKYNPKMLAPRCMGLTWLRRGARQKGEVRQKQVSLTEWCSFSGWVSKAHCSNRPAMAHTPRNGMHPAGMARSHYNTPQRSAPLPPEGRCDGCPHPAGAQ